MLIGSYTSNKVWHLFDPEAEGWQLNDKVWRIWMTLCRPDYRRHAAVCAARRRLPFYIFSGIYPLFLLFVLSGLAIRFYGFEGAGEGAGLFATLYSEQGRVIQAGIMVLIMFVAWLVRTRTPLGTTAGPALVVAQVLAALYFVIMIWGTI